MAGVGDDLRSLCFTLVMNSQDVNDDLGMIRQIDDVENVLERHHPWYFAAYTLVLHTPTTNCTFATLQIVNCCRSSSR